jgi:hypothetical protein
LRRHSDTKMELSTMSLSEMNKKIIQEARFPGELNISL